MRRPGRNIGEFILKLYILKTAKGDQDVFIIVIIMTVVKYMNTLYHKNGDTDDCLHPILGHFK